MTDLVTLMLVFVAVGVGFLLTNLLVGKLIRPARPEPEKGTVYECGEPPVGSSWIQFDLRFYVVALLFVIFDVEVAFFFPWATVFGTTNKLGNETTPVEARPALSADLEGKPAAGGPAGPPTAEELGAARTLARLAFVDILVFFGILLVGFAYVWKRGDLEWVRSMAAHRAPESAGGGGG
ncbi:MAG: NADH-quinone oxidoreductase subunit A [Zavarzinella sp.]|nr:NADH-quinone oxidoreductase subunit A [Zavarzinella sp.]